MVQKTVMELDQGQTFLQPFELEGTLDNGTPVTDFTGYKVRFVIKKNFDLLDTDALFIATEDPDPVEGTGQFSAISDITKTWEPGNYKYQGKLKSPSGTVLYTETGDFIVKPVIAESVIT